MTSRRHCHTLAVAFCLQTSWRAHAVTFVLSNATADCQEWRLVSNATAGTWPWRLLTRSTCDFDGRLPAAGCCSSVASAATSASAAATSAAKSAVGTERQSEEEKEAEGDALRPSAQQRRTHERTPLPKQKVTCRFLNATPKPRSGVSLSRPHCQRWQWCHV